MSLPYSNRSASHAAAPLLLAIETEINVSNTQQRPRVRNKPARILAITPFEDPDWRWLSGYFPEDKFSWEFMNKDLFGKKPPIWALHAWKATTRAAGVDVVVSHHPYMTLWTAAALHVRRVRTPHFAFSFNHGNKRFFTGPMLWLAKRVLPDVNLFNVLSTGERMLFNGLYDIPVSRIRFSHWAVHPPKIVEPLPDEYYDFQPYICAMGRNNRDFDTLLKATESIPVNIVIVCSKQDASRLPVRDNVKIKSEISLSQSLQILDGSLFSVVPLVDNSTGAGHMTFVHAMQLGKAQVVTDVENTHDYFIDGVHGLSVPARDVEAMRKAVRHLLEDVQIRESFGASARVFADRWLSELAAARSAREVIEGWFDEETGRLEPDGWSAYVDGLRARTGA